MEAKLKSLKFINMKKVLHIPNYFPPHVGGIEQVAFDIVNSLKNSYEQVVFAFNDKNEDVFEVMDGVKVYRCAVQLKVSSQAIALGYKKKLFQIIKDFQPDIIHFHFPNPFVAHYLLKCKMKAKIIVHYHSDIIKQKFLKKFFVSQTINLLNMADCIIATSPQYIECSEFLCEFKQKSIMIPNCINDRRMEFTDSDYETSQRIREDNKGKIICSFLGRHVEYKGLKYLIEAARCLDDNVVFRIAGSGKLTKQLKKQAKGLKNVEFIGRVPSIVSELYACDIFTFPSITKNEAFGIALAEAMWFYKPAVTFYIEGSGVNYVGLKDITCLECENRNVKQLAESINRLSKDEKLRCALGKNAHDRVQELFLLESFKKNILNLYEGL